MVWGRSTRGADFHAFEILTLYNIGWIDYGKYLCKYWGFFVGCIEDILVFACCWEGVFDCGCILWM